MVAYAALVSLMIDLELIQNHPRHSFSFENKQIASLSQTVHFLLDFMESYDSQGCSREAVLEVLESRIASTALAAHDVVELHLVDQIHDGTTLDGKARSYFLPDLQKAIDDMGFVKREAMQFKAKRGIKAEQITYSPPTSSQPLSSGKNCMVGFDAVLLQFMEMLTGEDASRLVIPIVGMGRLGKTTLARNAYDHLLIQDRFDVRHREKVASSMNSIWSLDEDEKCMNIVSLSYHQLSVCLKPCFLYFGILREDQLIDVPKLLRLWVAEGFVKPSWGKQHWN